MCSIIAACATAEGYQRNAAPPSILEARRQLYFGKRADANYQAATSNREQIRNQLVYGRMEVLEEDFVNFEKALNSTSNVISLGSDLTVLTLSGLGAVTGGEEAKSALAAASAGVVGARGAINKDLYYQKTLPALIAQMHANREAMRLLIEENLKQPDALYPLAAAEIDLQRLMEAGSLVNAVNEISERSVTEARETSATIQRLRTLTFVSTTSAKRLQAWLYRDGAVDTARLATLQAWLNRQPESFLKDRGYPPAAFVSGDTPGAELEAIRRRAVNDPTLQIPAE